MLQIFQILLIFLDSKGFWDWIINYIGNASGILQGIAAIIVVITFIITIKQLKKENRKRDLEIENLTKQTDRLQKLLEHEIKIRRNSIKPELKYDSYTVNAKQRNYVFRNDGKKAFDIIYNFTKSNEKEYILPSVGWDVLDVDHKECIAILIEYLVDKIKEPIVITFSFKNEDSECYHQEATIHINHEVIMGFPILQEESQKN